MPLTDCVMIKALKKTTKNCFAVSRNFLKIQKLLENSETFLSPLR